MEKPSAQKLDPQIAALIEAAKNGGAPALNTLSPRKARSQYLAGVRMLAGTPPKIAAVENKDIVVPGTRALPMRIYRPITTATNPLPVLIYFHGGGWCFGDLDTHDHICRWLCANSGVLVVSIDYRLGPEHKFPAAVDDAIIATRWVYENAGQLGADAQKLCVGGDSAGANLATVSALHARDNNGPKIIFQLLIYPATDMSMTFPSHTKYGDAYRLTRPLMIWSSLNYLRDGKDILDPRASPLLAESHADLPEALVITAGFDPLLDEGKAYAEKLSRSNVTVQYRCYEDMIHGFIGMTGSVDAAKDALKLAGESIKKATGN